MQDFNLVAIGTSIMWGQGLEDADKMHSVLCNLVQERLPDCKVNITFLAHSGATTGYKEDGSVNTKHKPRVHGEIPTFYPTIVQQIDEIDEHGIEHDAVDMILMDVGVNDVSLLNVLNPFVTTNHIDSLIEMYCHQHLVKLLERLTTDFKRATIVLVGYYQLLTQDSAEELIHIMLKALDLLPDNFLIDKIVDQFETSLKQRVISNCETFAASSYAAFEQSANEINTRVGARRVLIAPAPIDPTHAALSDDPWLYGIQEDLTPEDEVAILRADACQSVDFTRTTPFICEIASVCHPNPKGARAYAESILTVMLNEENLLANL